MFWYRIGNDMDMLWNCCGNFWDRGGNEWGTNLELIGNETV